MITLMLDSETEVPMSGLVIVKASCESIKQLQQRANAIGSTAVFTSLALGAVSQLTNEQLEAIRAK